MLNTWHDNTWLYFPRVLQDDDDEDADDDGEAGFTDDDDDVLVTPPKTKNKVKSSTK